MVRKKATLYIASLLCFLLSCIELSAQQKKWSKDFLVTQMNGGELYISYAVKKADSISFKIHSTCIDMKNTYACFAFTYLDRNKVERTYTIRDIPLINKFTKEYNEYIPHGITKIVKPYLQETVVAYFNALNIAADAASQKSSPE